MQRRPHDSLCLAALCVLLFTGRCGLPTEDTSERETLRSIDVLQAINFSLNVQRDNVLLLNGAYLSYTRQEVESRLDEGAGIRDIEYEQEFGDCDDFAFMTMEWVRNPVFGLKGIAFGVMKVRDSNRVAGHCVNIFVDHEMVVWVSDLKKKGSIMERADSSLIVFWVII